MADDVVKRAKDNWKHTTGVYSAQKERELDDLRFCVSGNQWTAAALKEREAWTDGANSFQERPHPEIDKLAQPIRIVVNQWRAAHLGLNIHPDSETAEKEIADIIQGRYRKDERDSGASQARYWGYDRAVKSGVGWYFLGYDYDAMSEHPFDQRIKWDRVLDGSFVYPDPSSTAMDWADGDYMFWSLWMARDKFVRDFGKSELAERLGSGHPDTWSTISQADPDWVKGKSNDGMKDAVRVVKYWEKKYTEREAALLDDWSFVYVDEEGTVPKGRTVVTTRLVREQSLMYHCLTGAQEKPLHSSKWNGKWFPLVPVIGEEKQPYDDERRWEGMVRPAKDPQRTYNWGFGLFMEALAVMSKATRLADPRQIAKYRAWWDQAHMRNFPFLPYDATIEGVQGIIPPPVMDQADMSKMQSAMMMVQQAGEAIQDTTSLFDASLGRKNPADRSGKAILAQQGQGDAATDGYKQNFLTITLPCEGRIYLDLFPTIYERPGRVLHIQDGEDEKSRRVMVGVPYTMKDGQPKRVEPGTQNAKVHDFRKGIYSLEAEAGRSYTSRVEQGQEQWPLLIQSLGPEAGLVLAPTLLDFSDTPGAQQAAEMLRKVRDAKMPFLVEPEDGQELTPEQMKAKGIAMEQQLQQAQQMIQQLQQEVQTDGAKQQATLAKAQIDAQVTAAKTESDNSVKLEISRQDNETRLVIAKLQAEQVDAATRQKDAAKKLDTILGLLKSKAEFMQESRLDDEDGAHEVGLKAMELKGAREQREHDAAMGAAHAFESREERESNQAHEREIMRAPEQGDAE